MSGGFFTGANVDLTAIDRRLADVDQRAHALAPALRALRRPLISDQKAHAKAGAGPDGAWPPRAAATEARRKAKNRRTKQTKAMRTISPKPSKRRSTPRQLLGRLPMIFQVIMKTLSIGLRSRAPWSGAHMRGAKVGHGRKVELPKRTYYYPSDALLVKAKEIFAAYIIKDWRKK